jgi:signal peptidase I
LTIAIAVAAVLLIKAFVVNPYKIPSSSMEPTFHCARPGTGCEGRFNDRVIANRFIYHFRDPERGDIVVFDPPADVAQYCGAGGTYVKRIIGLPGERLSQRNGVVYVDGKELPEPYLEPVRRGGPDFGPTVLGPDQYFMMGDNRQLSCDSRRWGPITREAMIGPVFMTYWPPNRISFR